MQSAALLLMLCVDLLAALTLTSISICIGHLCLLSVALLCCRTSLTPRHGSEGSMSQPSAPAWTLCQASWQWLSALPPLRHQGYSRSSATASRSRAAKTVGGASGLFNQVCRLAIVHVSAHSYLIRAALCAPSCPIHVQLCVWLLSRSCALMSSSYAGICALMSGPFGMHVT